MRRAAPAAALFIGGACAFFLVCGFSWQLPRGFPEPVVPPDNPMSAAKVALGRRLFFEPRISVSGRYSCASCHEPLRAFTDGRPLAIGATGESLTRNAMTLVNVAYNSSYGWSSPDVLSLEAQMRQPLFNTHPVEIGLAGREKALLEVLAQDPQYAGEFSSVFADDPPALSVGHLIRAIAAFERTLISGNSPFDRYIYHGDHRALGDSAKRGMRLFYSARLGCASCHGGFNFTGTWNERNRPAAVPAMARNGTGSGRVRVRVPTLRNILLTAPYMHDGRYLTLESVIRQYEAAGTRTTLPDRRLRRFHLNDAERQDLLTFFATLTDAQSIAGYNGAQ